MREVEQSLERAPAPEPNPPRRIRRRRLPILIAAVVVLSGAAVGWAFLTSSARDTVAVECEIQGTDTIIPAASGDPVSDCATQWKRDTGTEAPALAAYDNGLGGITVLPASQTPPSGFTRLPGGAVQNVSMVEMQQWLDDYVSGLNSGCFGGATAAQMTKQQLARLGMTGWTVLAPPASDAGTCVDTGILDASNSTVALRALSGPVPPGSVMERLAAELRPVARDCEPLGATAQRVRSAAGKLGLSEDAHQYELNEVPDASATCTTISENVGGTIFLILRGPAG
ncbi:MAG TPA: hypothetical protein VID47_09020 [Actinomycetota bacterium]|jgi:hypothetical protein